MPNGNDAPSFEEVHLAEAALNPNRNAIKHTKSLGQHLEEEEVAPASNMCKISVPGNVSRGGDEVKGNR